MFSRTGWALLFATMSLVGCGDDNRADPAGGGGEPIPIPTVDRCATPDEGCACKDEGEVIDCGRVTRKEGDYVTCSMGKRACSAGVWGVCEGDRISTVLSTDGGDAGVGTKGLAGSSTACKDPCDPYCVNYVDDALGLDAGAEAAVIAKDGGLLLPGGGTHSVDAGPGCTGLTVSPTPQTMTITSMPTGVSTGLLGEYMNHGGSPASPLALTVIATRVDPQVNFDWGGGAPGIASIGSDNFAVRWTGTVFIPTAGSYKFYVTGDDGVALWINGTKQTLKRSDGGTDSWRAQGPTEYVTPAITLAASATPSIRFEYFENGGGATAQLAWEGPSITKAIIPSARLAPPGGPDSVLTISPSTVDFSAKLIPTGCYPVKIAPVWGVDRLDIATVTTLGTGDGRVQLYSPVAGPISVTGYLGPYKNSGIVNVVVAVDDTRYAPTGVTASSFTGTTSGSEGLTWLYPYEQTVLPLGLQPPVVQYDANGVAASAVQITLRVPDPLSATPLFRWSSIRTEGVSPRLDLPVSVWRAFEQTARGKNAELVIQRIVGGALKPAVTRTIKFATEALRGRIYYTEYSRSDNSAKVRSLDPGHSAAPVNIFAALGSGCPVCHSVSANGKVIATSDSASWGAGGGISRVETGGTISWMADVATADRARLSSGGNDWRGFAWSPLSPDGQFMLSANNVYGNTSVPGIGTRNAGNGTRYRLFRNFKDPATWTAFGTPEDMTYASGSSNWNGGLGTTAMMVPSFSPDGKKLVFVDGDDTGGAGWRKGLSTFNVDLTKIPAAPKVPTTEVVFSGRKNIVNNWSTGPVVKWPTFESDSRSVLYSSTVPNDWCCTNSWTIYGQMAPTNYYETPSRLASVDSGDPTKGSVFLDMLNLGEGTAALRRGIDANKSYQPTVFPDPAGGYRWAVFTSTRPYGNTLNYKDSSGSYILNSYANTSSYSAILNYSKVQSELWVAALDDTTSATTDRSHPGFWLPNQNYDEDASRGYTNERAFWARDACKPIGDSCEVNDECCGATASVPTAACRISSTATVPPTRACTALGPLGSCSFEKGSCAKDADCCSPDAKCIAGACTTPPPVDLYGPGTFVRDYVGTCPTGSFVVWRFFDHQSITPSNASGASNIVVEARTAQTVALVATATKVFVDKAIGAPTTGWVGKDVGAALKGAGLSSKSILRIELTFNPTPDYLATPVLTNWRQAYSCVPSE